MRILLSFFYLCVMHITAQSLHVASSYYKLGKFESAALSYQSILKKSPRNPHAIKGLAKSYRQLSRFSEATELLQQAYEKQPNQLMLLLELGVTYLQNKQDELATKTFDKVILNLDLIPNSAGYMGQLFREYHLLKYTIKSYEKATAFNPNINYKLEIGQLYGELGELSGMFDNYLDYMLDNPIYIGSVKRLIDDFITEDAESEANKIFRKTLLKKNQAAPDILFNEMLSWLFVQQKQYRKAFTQERAIYRQTEDGIPQILNIGNIAFDYKDYETAEEVYDFVLENTNITSFKVKAHQQLLNILKAPKDIKTYKLISEKYLKLFEEYNENAESLPLYLDYAKFIGFTQNRKKEAINFLKPLSRKKFSMVNLVKIYILLGDVLVSDSKFNQALIYYTRAQKKLKNHQLAQEASFKIAKTSYYKGDFDWANTQLNVLKESTTQLIANDAMDLSLRIYDNTKDESNEGDEALKLFAAAELLEFQENINEAINVYTTIIEKFQGLAIEDDAYYNQALLYIENDALEAAIKNLKKIPELFPLSLLVDDAYYKLGELYEFTGDTEAAKLAYEKIIFNHADSIHFVEARKAYRKLRGDAVIN